MMDDMLPDWQGQNNLIDLDDFDPDDLMNDTKENSMHRSVPHKTDRLSDSANKSDTLLSTDRKIDINEIQEKIKFLRKKLREFEDNFERQHGCRPQNLEKTGNSQVYIQYSVTRPGLNGAIAGARVAHGAGAPERAAAQLSAG